MKVFNLCCENDHRFEGWFGTGDDYERQQRDGILQCPMCGTASVSRLPSAPRLNLGAQQPPTMQEPTRENAEPASASKSEGAQMVAQPTAMQMQRLWAQMAKIVQSNTEDVGDRFAEEARRIHYNEAPERGIRGVATPEEASDLADEGIEVIAFPMPDGMDGPLQ
ncbi:MAG: DUF1178 family protein [Burkholderiaceae bacterium]